MNINVLKLWYAARDSSSGGIFIRTTDQLRLKSLLYAARKQSNDPSLQSLTVRTSPLNPKDELLILQGLDMSRPAPNGQR